MLTELLDKWERHMQVLRGLSPRTTAVYRAKVLEFFNWHGSVNDLASFNREDLTAVTQADIERFLEFLFYERANGNHTRLTKLSTLAGFWRFLVYSRVVTEDVTENVPKPRVWKKMIQDLTQEERLRMFGQVDLHTEKGLRDACILILLTFCGLRVGEVVNLRINDMVDEDGVIFVQLPDDIVKQHGSRTVDLWKAPSVFIRQWLQMRLGRHGAGKTSLVFVSYRKGDRVNGHPLYEKDIDRLVKHYAAEAGIRRVRVHAHMFRASHGSDLRHVQGYDLPAIAERLGHKNISTTDRYLPRRRGWQNSTGVCMNIGSTGNDSGEVEPVRMTEGREALDRFGRRVIAEFGEAVGMAIHRILIEELGGLRISVPDIRQLEREAIHARIRKEFNGANYQELALRFGLSVRWVRRIINNG